MMKWKLISGIVNFAAIFTLLVVLGVHFPQSLIVIGIVVVVAVVNFEDGLMR